MESRLVDGQWTEATVASFSGTYPDIDPWLSPDGESLYFSSIRPVEVRRGPTPTYGGSTAWATAGKDRST